MEILLEVMAQRQVDEGALARGEFHGGGQAALHHPEIACRQVAVKVTHITMYLKTVVRWQAGRIEGDFGFLTGTTADAQDTLDWISAQEWSNGKVGLHGCSSTAENQLKLGAIGHPALWACVPMSSGAGIGDIPGAEGSNGCFFRGGVPMIKTWALWHAPFGIRLRPSCP